MRGRRFGSSAFTDRKAQRISGITLNRCFNDFICRRFASGERPILAFYSAGLKLLNQIEHGFFVFRHHHQTRGVAVETMDNTGARQCSKNRVVSQKTIQKRVVPVPSGRMYNQSCGFIDDQDVVIFVNHVDVHRRSNEIHIFKARLNFNGNLIAETHFFFGFINSFAVDFDQSVFNQGLQTRAGNVF